MADRKPAQMLHTNHAGVVAADGTVSVLSDIYTITIQKGLGIVIPGRFKLVLKLLDDASNEMGANTEVYFGFRTSEDPRRTVPVGGTYLYSPWKDLSTGNQRKDEYAASVGIDLGHEFLALKEDEKLIISVYGVAGDGSGTVDETYCQFEIPYTEGAPETLAKDLELRRLWWGR